jgi:hypothetical protein
VIVTGLVVATGLSGCGLVGGERSTFCELLEETYPAFPADPTKALPAGAGAGEWKAHFDVTHERTRTLIAAAPQELVAPLTGLQTTNDQLGAFYAEAEYDPAQMDTGALTQLISDTGYSRSLATVTAYAENTCHIDTGTTPQPSS